MKSHRLCHHVWELKNRFKHRATWGGFLDSVLENRFRSRYWIRQPIDINHHIPSSISFLGKKWWINTPSYCTFGDFHSHGGTPIAGWFLLGKIPSFEMEMDDDWGTPISGNFHLSCSSGLLTFPGPKTPSEMPPCPRRTVFHSRQPRYAASSRNGTEEEEFIPQSSLLVTSVKV